MTSQLKGLGVTVNGEAIDGDSYDVVSGHVRVRNHTSRVSPSAA